MSKYKASFYNLFFNFFNIGLSIIQGLFLIPFYLHYLSSSLYGSWLATGNILAMVSVLEGGVSNVITQKLSNSIMSNDRKKYLELAGANIMSAFIISFLLLLICILLSFFIIDLICTDKASISDLKSAFILAAIAVSISIFSALIGAFPQVWQDTKYVGRVNSISIIINILVIVGGLYWGYGILSLAFGLLAKSLFNLIFQSIWISVQWNKRGYEFPLFSLKLTFQLLKECGFPFLSRLSSILISQSQNFLIAVFISPSATTVYDITGKIVTTLCNMISVVYGSFFALFSLIFSTKDYSNIKSTILNVNFLVSFLTVIILLFSICFSESIISLWVGKSFFGGKILLILISLALISNSLNGYLNSFLYTCGLINNAAVLDILKLSIYIVLISLLGNIFGIIALPLSMLLSSLTISFFYLINIIKKMKIELSLFKTFLYDMSLGFILIAIFMFLDINMKTYGSILLNSIILLSLFVIISIIFKKEQVRKIILLIKK